MVSPNEPIINDPLGRGVKGYFQSDRLDTQIEMTEDHLGEEATCFHVEFADQMVLCADAVTVGNYLDTHQAWFQRCAQPMHTESIGENGYALTIGKFGALGYDVEPKIGLELSPQEGGIYHIHTIEIPDYTPPGYEVDFKAWQKLIEMPTVDYLGQKKFAKVAKHEEDIPLVITKVEWHLDLSVSMKFPRFVHKLPKNLIQNTGDRLLLQIIQLVNHRLTQTVQQDFHTSLGISAKI